jgi:hypothetical protein
MPFAKSRTKRVLPALVLGDLTKSPSHMPGGCQPVGNTRHRRRAEISAYTPPASALDHHGRQGTGAHGFRLRIVRLSQRITEPCPDKLPERNVGLNLTCAQESHFANFAQIHTDGFPTSSTRLSKTSNTARTTVASSAVYTIPQNRL